VRNLSQWHEYWWLIAVFSIQEGDLDDIDQVAHQITHLLPLTLSRVALSNSNTEFRQNLNPPPLENMPENVFPSPLSCLPVCYNEYWNIDPFSESSVGHAALSRHVYCKQTFLSYEYIIIIRSASFIVLRGSIYIFMNYLLYFLYSFYHDVTATSMQYIYFISPDYISSTDLISIAYFFLHFILLTAYRIPT